MKLTRDEKIGLGLLALLWFFGKKKQHDVSLPLSSPADLTDADTGPTGNVSVESVTKAGVDWVWPVPTMVITSTGEAIAPVVSDGWGSPRDSGKRKHKGVDIMYPRQSDTPKEPDDHGSKNYFAPEGTPVLAARGGKVWSVSNTAKGVAVVLDHGKPYASLYLHLASANVKRGDTVTAGQPIGVMGYSPQDAESLRHLHFEVWKGGAGDHAIDPQGMAMQQWGRTTWNVQRVA